MKRLLPFTLVALLVLVPAGVVLAAKAVKAKTATVKVSHRSAKAKAANEKLVQELLTILDETDNKTTFAACCECLTQLKPPREVVVPAIIRKADKMGWLRAEGGDDYAMIGEFLDEFLPNKHRRQHEAPNNLPLPYNIQYPYPQPFPMVPPPPPAPSSYGACPVSVTGCSMPVQTAVCPCPCPNPCPCPCPCPCPTGAWHAVSPICNEFQIVSVASAPVQDRMTTELLKILNETESKTTFAFVVEALAGRDEHWDVIAPAIIRKADKMGWMRVPDGDKRFNDDFAESLFRVIADKVAPSEKQTAKPSCNSTGCICVPPLEMLAQFTGTGTIAVNVEEVSMPHTAERIPMPHTAEIIQMPHVEEVPTIIWSFFNQ